MREQLEKFIKMEGLTPSRFAEIMGVQPSSISHILGGRNKPSYDFIEKMLLRFPKVNPDWLILGKGSIYRQSSGETKINNSPAVNIPSDIFTQNLTSEPLTVEASESAAIINNKQESRDAEAAENLRAQNIIRNIAAIPGNEENDIDQVIVLYKDRTFITYRSR